MSGKVSCIDKSGQPDGYGSVRFDNRHSDLKREPFNASKNRIDSLLLLGSRHLYFTEDVERLEVARFEIMHALRGRQDSDLTALDSCAADCHGRIVNVDIRKPGGKQGPVVYGKDVDRPVGGAVQPIGKQLGAVIDVDGISLDSDVARCCARAAGTGVDRMAQNRDSIAFDRYVLPRRNKVCR